MCMFKFNKSQMKNENNIRGINECHLKKEKEMDVDIYTKRFLKRR
jgi:hypothetical protein